MRHDCVKTHEFRETDDMGSEVNAICKCGLETTILIGGGDGGTGATGCYFPCVCRDCEEVVQVDVNENNPKCPKCNGEDVIRYDDPRLLSSPGRSSVARWNVLWGAVTGKPIQTLELSDGLYKCPKCGCGTLTFSATGLRWD